MNTEKKVNVTVQLEPDLLAKVDARAQLEDLNRSQFLRRLVRKDLAENPLPSKQLELQEQAA